jgi:hypothetical protein
MPVMLIVAVLSFPAIKPVMTHLGPLAMRW